MIPHTTHTHTHSHSEDESEDESPIQVRFVDELAKKFKKKMHVAAVAHAIGDVIEEKKGPLLPASYFGVVLTALSDGKEKTEDEIVNLLSLLAFVFEKVSTAVLRSKFSFVSGVLLNIFSQCPESTAILIKLTTCVSHLLQVQDANSLQQQEGMNCINFFLSLSIHEMGSVATSAQKGLLSVFKSATASARKVLSGPVANFIHKSLTQTPLSEETAVPTLKLVRIVFRYLAPNHIAKLCEVIVGLPRVAIVSITTAAFQSILGLIPDTDGEEGAVSLQSAQIVSLIDVLIDMQPNLSDSRPLIEYSVLMTSLFSELAKVDSDICAQKLPTFVDHIVVNFASENREVVHATHDTLATVLQDCITDKMINQAVSSQKAPMRKIVESIETSLAPKYNRNWDKVLLVIAVLFEKLGPSSSALLRPILATVGELYTTLTPQTHMPVFAVLGFAISAMGPQKFLEVLPLNLESPEAESGPNPNRSWLLPLLRANIEQTNLSYFVEYFLPLSTKVTEMAERAKNSGKLVEAKNKQILHDQIWDLFPSFCTLPVDLPQTYKNIAKTMGNYLTDMPALRRFIYAGMQKLIDKNLEVSQLDKPNPELRVTPDMAKAGLKAMAQFSKNFLPIFFTVYGQLTVNDRKDALFNLISSYIKITDSKLVLQLFKTMMQKLLEASTEAKEEEEDDEEMDNEEKEARRRDALAAEKANRVLIDSYFELVSAFVPSLGLSELDFLFRVIKPYFESKNVHSQKRAYKVLREMSKREVFVKKFYNVIREFTVNAPECSSAAKKQRIFILDELLQYMPIEDVLSATLIADIIFCSREINAAARKIALQVLVKMAHRSQVEDSDSGLKNFMNLIVAGLAGTTPVMMSGSISALTVLVVEFIDVIDPIFVKDLVSTLSLLLQSTHVEVMTETVHFLKATMNFVDEDDLKMNLKSLVDGFAYMMRQHKGKFRDHGVNVVTKLLKRYGYEMLLPLFPEDCHKVLRAINKRETKKKDKSKKEKAPGEESSSDESDSEFLGENLLGSGNVAYDKQDEAGTFIIEDEEPLDFLDKAAMKRVISAKPQEKKEKQKKESEFKMLPDGRLLIQDSDDDEESHNIYLKATKEKLPIDDRMMDTVDKEMFGNKSRRMTKKRQLENERAKEDADEDDEREQARPINEKFKKNNKAKIGSNKYAGHQFKAKKAGGDIKIGKLEPFAYIPLDVKNLNKRRRHHAVNAFKPIAKASKKSAP